MKLNVSLMRRTGLAVLGGALAVSPLVPTAAYAASNTFYDAQGDITYVSAAGSSYASSRANGDIKKVTVTHSSKVTIRVDFYSLSRGGAYTNYRFIVKASNGTGLSYEAEDYGSGTISDWDFFSSFCGSMPTINVSYAYDYATLTFPRSCVQGASSVKVSASYWYYPDPSSNAVYVDDGYNKSRSLPGANWWSNLLFSNWVAYN